MSVTEGWSAAVIILGTGKSVVKALEVLSQHKVEGKKVIVLTLFVTPDSELISYLHTAHVISVFFSNYIIDGHNDDMEMVHVTLLRTLASSP